MKTILAAGILLAIGSSASAVTLFNLPFEVSTERSDAFNVRSCPVNGEVGVCYNVDKTLNLGTYSFDRERSYPINCSRRVFSNETLHGQVAKEYCPIRYQLAPAPFLL